MENARPVANWLLCIAVLVFAMVVVGGATRLTRSGLSIVEWRPVTGVLPPLSEGDWQAEFAKYRQFPEYRKVNHGMSLPEFKEIFWFEYAHRLLGRAIGVAFLLPFLWFLWRRMLPRRLVPGLAALFALGGVQGGIGWWMVASGLVDRPDVSQYRLALHLGTALLLYAVLFWLALRLRRPGRTVRPAAAAGDGLAVTALIFLQILLGALVAGTDAGLIYNTFPSMNGDLLPPEALSLRPWWLNLFENHAMVQFDHRIGAYAVTLGVLLFCWRRRRAVPSACRLLLAAVVLQVGLGIATLLAVVPVWLGVLHQVGALLLLSAAVFAVHRLSDGDASVPQAVSRGRSGPGRTSGPYRRASPT